MTRELRGNLVTLVGLDVDGAAVGVLVDATGRLVVDGGGGNMVSTHKARAYANTNQVIPDATWTKILLDSETYDPGANFDIVNCQYVAPVAGYYHVHVRVCYEGAVVVTAKRVGLSCYVNNADVCSELHHTASATTIRPGAGDTIHLNVGDVVTAYTYHTFGVASALVGGSLYTALSIFCISED